MRDKSDKDQLTREQPGAPASPARRLRLSLNRETVRVLTSEQLRVAAGGRSGIGGPCGNTDTCSCSQ